MCRLRVRMFCVVRRVRCVLRIGWLVLGLIRWLLGGLIRMFLGGAFLMGCRLFIRLVMRLRCSVILLLLSRLSRRDLVGGLLLRSIWRLGCFVCVRLGMLRCLVRLRCRVGLLIVIWILIAIRGEVRRSLILLIVLLFVRMWLVLLMRF